MANLQALIYLHIEADKSDLHYWKEKLSLQLSQNRRKKEINSLLIIKYLILKSNSEKVWHMKNL
jgi:hypothetical protein